MGQPMTHPLAWMAWGVATRALVGQAVSGDRHLVAPFPHGVLLAVIDGLGHGEDAAAAADIAVARLARHAHESVLSLVRRCHEGLKATRGVVMSLASVNAPDRTMTWLGVGNVEGLLLRADVRDSPAREAILLRGGVVGYQLPSLRASMLPIRRGDTLVVATDGIRDGFAEGLPLRDPPQQIADRILARFGKDTDDALVLVARFVGDAP
jgi:phosphoserine phosphatase RsbX